MLMLFMVDKQNVQRWDSLEWHVSEILHTILVERPESNGSALELRLDYAHTLRVGEVAAVCRRFVCWSPD
jgi:hypothetical protein